MTKSRPIKTGIIGAGHFGRIYARILDSLPGAELVGIMDLDRQRSAEVAAGFSVEAFRSLDELADKVEALAVVAPATQHAAICRQALERGLHVLVEKPFVLYEADAAELTAMADEAGLCLQVGHLERFNPAVGRALQIASAGRPLFLQSRRCFPYNPRISDVGVVMDAMIHDLDLALALAGEQPRQVQAVGRSLLSREEDLVQACLAFDGGLLAAVTASRVSRRVIRRLDITLPDAVLEVDCGSQRLTIHDDRGSREEGIDNKEPLREQLLHFLECVRGQAVPLVSGREGAAAVALAGRIMEAMKLSGMEGDNCNAID